jgi:hypothetical protein
MSRCLIGYLVGKYDSFKDQQSGSVLYLSSHEVLQLAGRIFSLGCETSDESLVNDVIDIQKAIYDGREKTFGGTFPFTINEAKDFIGQLSPYDGYWLSQIAHYDGEEYDTYSDDFSLVPLVSDKDQYPEPRVNRWASARFQAFRHALYSIKSDGLNELAEAWWAFFIASQVLALPGLGLTGSEIAEVSNITLSLPRSPLIVKAATFVLEIEQIRKQTLLTRRSKVIFGPVAASVSGSAHTTVNVLAISDVQAESFLRKHIGGDVWESLGEFSKNDLVEGEKYWAIAARDMGTGRKDWGSMVTLYARPVKAEVREKLKCLMELLATAGFTADEPTLGGCMRVFRVAYHAVRKGEVTLANNVSQSVREIYGLFSQNVFMEDVRNRADHANREKPITVDELIRFRTVIFHEGLFAVLFAVLQRAARRIYSGKGHIVPMSASARPSLPLRPDGRAEAPRSRSTPRAAPFGRAFQAVG